MEDNKFERDAIKCEVYKCEVYKCEREATDSEPPLDKSSVNTPVGGFTDRTDSDIIVEGLAIVKWTFL